MVSRSESKKIAISDKIINQKIVDKAWVKVSCLRVAALCAADRVERVQSENTPIQHSVQYSALEKRLSDIRELRSSIRVSESAIIKVEKSNSWEAKKATGLLTVAGLALGTVAKLSLMTVTASTVGGFLVAMLGIALSLGCVSPRLASFGLFGYTPTDTEVDEQERKFIKEEVLSSLVKFAEEEEEMSSQSREAVDKMAAVLGQQAVAVAGAQTRLEETTRAVRDGAAAVESFGEAFGTKTEQLERKVEELQLKLEQQAEKLEEMFDFIKAQAQKAQAQAHTQAAAGNQARSL